MLGSFTFKLTFSPSISQGLQNDGKQHPLMSIGLRLILSLKVWNVLDSRGCFF